MRLTSTIVRYLLPALRAWDTMLPYDSEYGNHEQIRSRDRTLGIDVHACKPPKGAQDIMVFAMNAIQAVLFVTEATDQPSPPKGAQDNSPWRKPWDSKKQKVHQPRRGERPDLQTCTGSRRDRRWMSAGCALRDT